MKHSTMFLSGAVCSPLTWDRTTVFVRAFALSLMFVLWGASSFAQGASTTSAGSMYSQQSLPTQDETVVVDEDDDVNSENDNFLCGPFRVRLSWFEVDASHPDFGVGNHSWVAGAEPSCENKNTIWTGGYFFGSPNQTVATRWIYVPMSANTLTFEYLALNLDNVNPGEYAYMSINGNEVFTVSMNDDADTDGYVPASVDLSAYAGQIVQIEIGNTVSTDGNIGNVFWGCLYFQCGAECIPSLDITCAADINVECGSEYDLEITGVPVVDAELCGDSIVVSYTDFSSDITDCGRVITRVWTITLGDLTETCTQIITVVDTQGPVITGFDEVVNLQCIEDVTEASATALDVCSGEAEVESFLSQTGELVETCCLTTANGPGADWGLWLPVLTEGCCAASANWVFDGCGHFDQYADGTAHVYGTIYNTGNPSQQFVVSLWLENKADWATWSGLGRNYKNDLGLPCATADHINWDYFELVGGFSTLTGAGDLAGDVLYLYHMPASYYFGFQKGIGANNKNCNNGLSGWFTYTGSVGGESVEGHGDINVDAECETPSEEFDCPSNTSFLQIFRAEDNCGNVTFASQIINVEDTTAPVFDNCPESVTIQCSDVVPAVAEGVTATDNCEGEVTISYLGETSEGGPCYTVITRTWAAFDLCGNRADCVQTITIVDTTAPVLSGLPEAEITVECDAVPAAAEVTATDNCDTAVVVNSSEEIVAGNCPGNYTIYRYWYAYDQCQNSVYFTQVIHVQDTTGPVFDPFEVYSMVECDQIPEAGLTATDACGTATVELVSQTWNSGGCLGVLFRIYTATDECGNTTTVEQYIAIQDWTAPSLEGVPAETTLECSEVELGENGNYFDDGGVYGVDNCGYHFYNNCLLPVTVTYSEEVVATEDSCDASFDIIRTWHGVDYCENDTTVSVVFHVVDTTAPELYIPYSYTIECDQQPWYSDASAWDNCSDVTISVSVDTVAGECPQSYDIVRTFVATDACGNVSEPQSQYIYVRDTTAPQFGEYANYYQFECDAEIVTDQPVASDNCGEVSYTTYDTELSYDGPCYAFFYRVTVATDECGNSSEAWQTVIIVDTTAPVITGEVEVEIPCEEFSMESGIFVTATDNCNEYYIEIDSTQLVSGECAGVYMRYYTAYDICQNASVQFLQIIRLTDETAPVGTEPEDISVLCSDTIPSFDPAFTDNCGGEVTVVYSGFEVTGVCQVTYTESWTATDNCGNSTTIDRNVTIYDNVNPWFDSFPADATVSCDQDLPAVEYPTASDNCDPTVDIEYTADTVAGDCPQAWFVYRTFRGVDDCGNQVQATQIISVVDETAPSFNDYASYYEFECDAEIIVDQPTASDNCGEVSYSSFDTLHYNTPCYSSFYRVTVATDECGNSSSVWQQIVIVDTTAPVITGESQVMIPCEEFSAETGIFVTATDNCNEVIIVIDSTQQVSGECAGVYLRYYTAYDICQNASEQFLQIIFLTDETAPVGTEPSDITVSCDEEIPSFDPAFTDNCGGEVTVVYSGYEITDICGASYTESWTATDNCNNSTTIDRVITITDLVAPEFEYVPSDITAECDEIYYLGSAWAYDNCDESVDITVDVDTTEGNCPSNYVITRTFTATDDCGNWTSATQTITIQDTTAPEFSDDNQNQFNYQCFDQIEVIQPIATDNCSEVVEYAYSDTVYYMDSCSASFSRIWTAMDACGNVGYAYQYISVYDEESPVIETILSNVYVECASEIPAPAQIVVSDNCDATPSVDVNVDVLESDECGNQVLIVAYSVTDNCGNSTNAYYYIYVNDETAPVLDGCPSDLVLACSDVIPAADTVTATDNCGGEIEVQFEQYYYGDMPAEGSIADCDLITPVRPVDNPCNYPYDWAMAMFNMPIAHRYFSVSEGELVRYPNGTIHVVATMNNVQNPANGFLVDVWFGGEKDWATWSTQLFPTSFKADCGGEGENHEEWLYFVLQAGEGAEMTGFGAYAGSVVNLAHAPANNYFGYQLGDGANNYNGAENGFGGWFTYSGTFFNGEVATSVSGAGDFAFELDCCPDYYVVRQWTATDCSGNSATCMQTITFEGTEVGPLMPGTSTEAAPTKEDLSVLVAPNPADNNTVFTFKSTSEGKAQLEVFDMAGAKVADVFNNNMEAGLTYRVDFNVNNLATGIYMFRITQNGQTQMGRLVISK